MSRVAIVGTRYRDLAVESEILTPLGAEIVSGWGGDRADLVEIAGDADVIMAGSAPRFDAETIAELNCRGIVRYGVGVDKVDLEAAAAAGIWVARVVDYGTEAVALHAVTTALAGLRRIVEADRGVRNGGWGITELRPLHLPASQTAGVVGYGRIGRRTAELFAALGFEVLAHDEFAPPGPDDVANAATLREVLERSDVVSLHCPPPAAGGALLGAPELALMRPGSVLVNTARGALVDLEALGAAMAAGRPQTAALDVFPAEPPDLTPVNGVIDRLILTPHMAWYTEETELALRRSASEEAARLLAGEAPLEAVATPAAEPAPNE
jgi:D-3-phosphoglycerate dehydrogenase